MEAPTSFASRRPAATALPTFQLPPPELPSMQSHPPPAHLPPAASSSAGLKSHLLSDAAVTQLQPPTPSVSSILTPPSGVSTDGLSPLSSGVHSTSSQSSQPSAGGPVYYSHVAGSWSHPANSGAYNYSTSASQPQGSLVQQYGGRSLYSPSLQYGGARTASSPATGDGLPPPYHQELPTFPTGMSNGGGSAASNMNSQNSPAQLQGSVLGSQTGQSQVHASTNPSQQADPYRAPPTPGYYPPSSTPQQASFPSYAPAQPSPTQPSPTTSATSRTLSSLAGQPGSLSGMAPPHGYLGARATGPSYGYPMPHGSVMSGMGAPGQGMGMVGGVGGMGVTGYGAHHPGAMGHMYAQHQQPQQDRPFKCDQCPQSFNRNHDLKRHKRIHLAVKPFPCNYCDKSFSRKDALKRHRLVKGCGDKKNQSDGAGDGQTNGSPRDRSEILSDATEESPKMGLKAETRV